MRGWRRIGAAALFVIALGSAIGIVGDRTAEALSTAERTILFGVPGWVLSGAALDYKFTTGQYYQKTKPCSIAGSCLTVTRASTGYAQDTSGNWWPFASNVARITNKGLLVEESRTNLFLNSQAPATQTITVVNGSTYTASVYGTATLTLSGAGSGTVTQGSPVTFTAGSTSLTVTVTGAGGTFQNAQVELGSFATSPIPTSGSAAARAADVVTVTHPPAFGSAYTLYASGVPEAPSGYGTAQKILEVDDGTTNNRVNLNRTLDAAIIQLVIDGSSVACPGQINGWNTSALGKTALSMQPGNQWAAFDGIAAPPSTTSPIFVPSDVYIGNNGVAANQQFDGYVNRVTIVAVVAWTESFLQQITSGSGP